MKRALFLVALVGCGAASPSSTSSSFVPASPSPVSPSCAPKTFDADASPILHARCAPCHMPGGEEADEHDFSRPEKARAQRRLIAGKVSAHAMPPPGAATLTKDEEATLVGWASCGD